MESQTAPGGVAVLWQVSRWARPPTPVWAYSLTHTCADGPWRDLEWRSLNPLSPSLGESQLQKPVPVILFAANLVFSVQQFYLVVSDSPRRELVFIQLHLDLRMAIPFLKWKSWISHSSTAFSYFTRYLVAVQARFWTLKLSPARPQGSA